MQSTDHGPDSYKVVLSLFSKVKTGTRQFASEEAQNWINKKLGKINFTIITWRFEILITSNITKHDKFTCTPQQKARQQLNIRSKTNFIKSYACLIFIGKFCYKSATHSTTRSLQNIKSAGQRTYITSRQNQIWVCSSCSCSSLKTHVCFKEK